MNPLFLGFRTGGSDELGPVIVVSGREFMGNTRALGLGAVNADGIVGPNDHPLQQIVAVTRLALAPIPNQGSDAVDIDVELPHFVWLCCSGGKSVAFDEQRHSDVPHVLFVLLKDVDGMRVVGNERMVLDTKAGQWATQMIVIHRSRFIDKAQRFEELWLHQDCGGVGEEAAGGEGFEGLDAQKIRGLVDIGVDLQFLEKALKVGFFLGFTFWLFEGVANAKGGRSFGVVVACV